jgi:hypothetical protein
MVRALQIGTIVGPAPSEDERRQIAEAAGGEVTVVHATNRVSASGDLRARTSSSGERDYDQRDAGASPTTTWVDTFRTREADMRGWTP